MTVIPSFNKRIRSSALRPTFSAAGANLETAVNTRYGRPCSQLLMGKSNGSIVSIGCQSSHHEEACCDGHHTKQELAWSMKRRKSRLARGGASKKAADMGLQ